MQKFQKKIVGWGAYWFNLVGKTVLIKVVLSSLQIYPCSGLLALKFILTRMSIMIQNILWKGGKNNDKNFHLINLNAVQFQKEKGGLGIRNPLMVNISPGAKLVSKLIPHSKEWYLRLS